MAPDMERSDIVLSQQGRDKGRLMMVLDTDAEYLLLADGRRRRVERPKHKKIRHVSFVAKSHSEEGRRLRKGEKLSNSEVRRVLRQEEAPTNAE